MEKSDLDLLAQAESELKFLLDDAGVPAPVHVLVLKCGYDSVRVFAGLDDSKEAVRKALREELPLDYTASPENHGLAPPCLGCLPLTVVSARETKIGGQARCRREIVAHHRTCINALRGGSIPWQAMRQRNPIQGAARAEA